MNNLNFINDYSKRYANSHTKEQFAKVISDCDFNNVVDRAIVEGLDFIPTNIIEDIAAICVVISGITNKDEINTIIKYSLNIIKEIVVNNMDSKANNFSTRR